MTPVSMELVGALGTAVTTPIWHSGARLDRASIWVGLFLCVPVLSVRPVGPSWHRFYIDNPCHDIYVRTKLLGGSGVTMVVSTDSPNPTMDSNTWSWRSDNEELLIRHQDPKFQTGWYYVGVICMPNSTLRTDFVPELCPAKYEISFATRIGLEP